MFERYYIICKKKFKLNNQERQFNARRYNRDFQKFNEKPVISTMPESTKFGGDLNERIKKMEQMRKQNNFQQNPNHVNNNMNNIYNSNNFNHNSMSNHFNNLNNNLKKTTKFNGKNGRIRKIQRFR